MSCAHGTLRRTQLLEEELDLSTTESIPTMAIRPTYYGRTQLLEEEVDLGLGDAEGAGYREVDAGVGVMVRAVVCEADSRNGLGLGGGHLGVMSR